MRALSYLFIMSIKNRILSLKKKPAMLILYIVIAASVLFSIVILLVIGGQSPRMNIADERILFLILSGVGLLYLWLFTNTGLSTGSTLFTMPDVGLMFVAPISPKKILIYGLVSTAGKSMLASIFILFQFQNLRNFGYGITEMILLFLVFTLMVLFCQLLSIGIYIFSNGNPSRKRLVSMLLYLLIAGVAAAGLLLQKQQQVTMPEAFLRLIDTNWFGYVPIAGWIVMLFDGLVNGSFASAILGFALFLGFGGIILSLLTTGTADYYEDVLVSTETNYNTLNAKKEGRNIPVQRKKKNKLKDSDIGIQRGSGAYTLLYKQLLEMRRKSRIVFIDNYTIFVMAGAGVAGYYMKKFDIPVLAVYGILGLGVYLQFIFSMMGRLKQELSKPFIYLIPEPSIKKVFAASLTSMIKHGVDGAGMFLAYTLVSGIVSPHSLFAAIAYTASGAVFVALTILYQRVLGGQPNRMVQMLLSSLLLIAVMGPSIALTVVAAIFLPSALQFLCTLPFTIICLGVTALVFVACGNLLDKSELAR